MARVQPGESLSSIRAADWNDVLALLGQWRRGGRVLSPLGGQELLATRPAWVWVKNTTTSAVPAFGVLALDQPIFDLSSVANEKYEGVRFDGVTPSTSTPHYGKFAVLQEPAEANGGFARGVIAGQTLAKLNIADADDVACDIANSTTSHLTTSMHGSARILWKSSGTGSSEKYGLIEIGSWVSLMLGKTSGAINKAASGTVTIWSGAIGSEATTGVDVTAYNRFANVSTGKWVVVASILGRLYLIAAEC